MESRGIIRTLLVLGLGAAVFHTYRQYQELKLAPMRRDSVDSTTKIVSRLGSQFSDLHKFTIRQHMGAWEGTCKNLAANQNDTHPNYGERIYKDQMQNIANDIRKLRQSEGLSMVINAKGAFATQLFTFADWLAGEGSNDRPFDCTGDATANKLTWLGQVATIYDDCLHRIADLAGLGEEIMKKAGLDECAQQLAALPAPSPQVAQPAAAPSTSAVAEQVVKLDQAQPQDKVVTLQASKHKQAAFVVSPDQARVAYVVERTGQQLVVIDGEEGLLYDTIVGAPIFSADSRRVAYVARTNDEPRVVVDGKEGPTCKSIFGLTFSPTKSRLAYVALKNDRWWVVVDDDAQAINGPINTLGIVFSPDSAHVAYVSGDRSQQWVVVDGGKGSAYDGFFEPGPVFSADSSRVAYVAKKGQKMVVVTDGNESPAYDQLLWARPIFSPDSTHVAYAAVRNGKQFVVIDGKEGAAYDFINFLSFSPDSTRVLYLAVRNKKFVVVVDGRESPTYDSIIEPGPVFSPDSRHVGYNAKSAAKGRLVLDGTDGPIYDGLAVGSPAFSPSSTRVAYVASKDHTAVAVIDGHEGPPYDRITGNVTFSPDSTHTAYVARKDGKWHAVVDGAESPAYEEILASGPLFSSDSRHVAYAVNTGYHKVVVLDGKEQQSYPDVDVASLRFSPDSAHLAYTAWNGGWRAVVGGIEATSQFTKLVDGAALTFSSPTHLYALVESSPEGKVSRLDVDIPSARSSPSVSHTDSSNERLAQAGGSDQ